MSGLRAEYELPKEFQVFWCNTAEKLQLKGKKALTIKRKLTALKLFCEYTNATKISDLEKIELAELFLKQRKELSKDQTIKANIMNLSTLIEMYQKRQKIDEYNIYAFEKNVFKYLLETTKFTVHTNHFQAREIIEIKTWIKMITNIRYQALFVLYALGLRKHEPLALTKAQFHLSEYYISDVARKGSKVHKKIGLPNWTIPYLENHLKTIEKDSDKVFNHKQDAVCHFYDNHFNRIIKIIPQLEKKGELNSYWSDMLRGLKLIQKNGKITPHQLRESWSSLATSMRIHESFKKYHLNHSRGLGDTYDQFEKQSTLFEQYLEELNTRSPNFDL